MITYRKPEFNNIADAFKSLPEELQDHCIRVSEYMKIMFLEACAVELRFDDPKSPVRLKEEYAELMVLAGLYHDVAKALVPEYYMNYNQDYSEEEKALFFKHTSDSAKMLRQYLSDKGDTRSVVIGFAEEAILDHHELWNGNGYPAHKNKGEISILGRILNVVDALDHMSVEKRCESPMDYAITKISSNVRADYDPEVCNLLKSCRPKLKRVFDAHISHTRAVPKTDQLIRRMASRPFALWYRPVMQKKDSVIIAYEAEIRFRNKKDWQTYYEVDSLLKKGKMEPKLAEYMLVEACDTEKRFESCEIKAQFISLELPTGVLNKRGEWKDITAVIDGMDVPRDRICIVVGDRTASVRTKTMDENIRKLSEAGVQTMAAVSRQELLSDDDVKTGGYAYYSVRQDTLDGLSETAVIGKLSCLTNAGITVIADGVDRAKFQPMLRQSGVIYITGPLAGEYIEEDVLIDRELSQQQ